MEIIVATMLLMFMAFFDFQDKALDNRTLIWHRSSQASWRQSLDMTVLRCC
ncbi:MAG: hypothetical protein OXF73_05415 [Gammaproteobacteria bacterium]|nr:hypothetical protein [Gammaproteobacteria bacterium]MCY4226599.1 hypothetical protein [Gammaproteobacteria bacterium]